MAITKTHDSFYERQYEIELQGRTMSDLYEIRDDAHRTMNVVLAKKAEEAIVILSQRQVEDSAQKAADHHKAMRRQIDAQNIASAWYDDEPGQTGALTTGTWPGAPSMNSIGSTVTFHNSVAQKPLAAFKNEEETIRENIQVFKGIRNKKVVDVGVMGSSVCITFADNGILKIKASFEDCKLYEQNDLASLNGQDLGDITVNPQYSIAGEMCCMLICYSRYGVALTFSVFCKLMPIFKFEYDHEKS